MERRIKLSDEEVQVVVDCIALGREQAEDEAIAITSSLGISLPKERGKEELAELEKRVDTLDTLEGLFLPLLPDEES